MVREVKGNLKCHANRRAHTKRIMTVDEAKANVGIVTISALYCEYPPRDKAFY